MPAEKKVYKNPSPGQPLLTTISSNWVTPVLEVKFCNLVNPYRYQNSPTVPRYSITCLVDPHEHSEFLKVLQKLEKDEGVETIIKNETSTENGSHVNTGKLLVKFQSKNKIPVYMAGEYPPGQTPVLELEDELAKGERVSVVYDVLRYTKKNNMTTELGLSFKPSLVYYHAPENS